MIVGLLCCVVANLASICAAKALVDRMGTHPAPVRFLLLLILRLTLITAVLTVCGMANAIRPIVLGGLGAVTLVLLGLRGGVARYCRVPEFPKIGLASGVIALVLIARLAAQVWYFAPYNGDALSYHLPKVAEWIRAGGFTRQMGVDTHVNFPAGFELIETWWCLFLRHDGIIETAGVEFLLLAFAAVYALAAELGLGSRAAFVAGLMYTLTPGVYLQATCSLNDGAVAALIIATMALVVAQVPVALLLIPAGLGMGIKPTFVYALPGILLVLAATRGRLEPRPPQSRLALGVAAVSLLAGAFWYLRNILWFGNPIYPVGTAGLAGANPIQFGVSSSAFLGNVRDLVNSRIYDSASAYGPYLDHISGWGALPFVCGVPALLAWLREEQRIRLIAGAMLVSLVSVLFLVLHDPWSMRFVLFFPSLFAVAVARMVERSRIMLCFAALCLLIQFVGTDLPDQLPLSAVRSLAQEPWPTRCVGKIGGMWHEEDAIGYFVDQRHVAYPLYRPDFSARVVYLRPSTPEDLLRTVKEEKLGMIYAAPAKADGVRIIEECERRGKLRRLNGNFFAVR